MNKEFVLAQFILFSQFIDEFGKEVYKLLKEKGFSDEDIETLDKYSSLYIWTLVMNDYICGKNNFDGYELYALTLIALGKSLLCIEDSDLKSSMMEFLKYQSIEKATEIIKKIKNRMPVEVVKDLFEKVLAIVLNEKTGRQKIN